ncbi:MAG: plasmid partitioning protein RepA [Mesorhizobium sp.]|nr:plasmid partitioning protein RepA [Mesorhizobium sp.]RWJ39882.1 MAG: plasmid partitioning protein RepA [Mesorhizobium sp.]RWJ81466.1 MAG: plasmid partitioning protein RepA [Mesorhizobium sp.]TIR04053.1 MAG: plasmid partitioning protein RepA [Mesorhizobium sp.]
MAARADKLAAGETIVELEPDTIDVSFVRDRRANDEREFNELVEAVRENGQNSPILVRPHPKNVGRYMVVFGHRRLEAAKYGRSDAKKYVPFRKPGEKLQVIAVVNFKGGSGKTTTAAHLAQHLALTGHRVLAIDLDPQASLSALHGFQPELDGNPSLYDAIRYDEKRQPIADVILPTNFPLLEIIPANLELQEYEFDTPLSMQTSNEGKRFYSRLGRSLEEVDDRFDVVIVDCPPQLGFLTLTALTASTSVLVTVHPQMLDLMSMSQFLLMLGNFVRSIREKGAPVKIDWLRYLITRYEPSDVPQTQMLGFMQSILAEEILKNPMVKSTAISDAGLTKQTLYEVERVNFNRDTYDRAIEALDAANFEIQGLLHRAWGRL